MCCNTSSWPDTNGDVAFPRSQFCSDVQCEYIQFHSLISDPGSSLVNWQLGRVTCKHACTMFCLNMDVRLAAVLANLAFLATMTFHVHRSTMSLSPLLPILRDIGVFLTMAKHVAPNLVRHVVPATSCMRRRNAERDLNRGNGQHAAKRDTQTK